MLDIEAEDVRKVDKDNMIGDVGSFPQMFERAVGATEDLQATFPRAPRNVLITGMGGSAIGGDLLAHAVEGEAEIPITVNRDYRIPNWVNEDTLVLAASYSGNTEETLAAFSEARARGAMLAAVSTGGRLKEFAEKADAPFVPVEKGFQPRAATPLMVVPQARLLHLAGVVNTENMLIETTNAMKAFGDELLPQTPAAQNESKRIAQAVEGTVPFIYGSGPLSIVATRWMNDFNENSKILAHAAAMPEMNHNELVGWSGDDELDRFTAILLRHEDEHPQNQVRLDFTAKAIQERGGRVVQVQARGKNPLAQMLTSTYLGSMASIYLAVLRERDPSPVDVIHALKKHVGDTGFVEKLTPGA